MRQPSARPSFLNYNCSFVGETSEPALEFQRGRDVGRTGQERDGRQIASHEFPVAGVKRQISIDGGDQPQWAPDGKRLFYANGNRIMSVDLASESGLHSTKPRLLFERRFSSFSADSGVWGHTWAVFPDGKRFLFVDSPVQPEVRELRVVLNWFEELKARVPTK